MEIVKDLEALSTPAKPLEFLTDKGIEKEEGEGIIKQLKDYLDTDRTVVTVAAPQLGIDKRIFCMRFQDTIKTFINPVITKKAKYNIQPETFASMPGKEILISRPEEITVVYYTDEFKYEENKLLGIAARVFDQSCQLLDGITPDILGVVSDIEEDGSLWDASDEEMTKLKELYCNIIAARNTARNTKLQEAIKEDPELAKQFKQLQFTEKVINGDAAIVGKNVSAKGQATAAMSIKKAEQANNAYNRAQMTKMANKSRKHKGKRK